MTIDTNIEPVTIKRLQAAVPEAAAMLAGIQLGVFSQLHAGPADLFGIAGALSVEPGRLARLLFALVATDLLKFEGGRFHNSPEADRYLVEASPSYVGATHELTRQIWAADLTTAASIRTGRPGAAHDFSSAPDEEMSAMLGGMHGNAVRGADDLLRNFDFSSCRSLVDVGGGSGGLVATMCDRLSALNGTLFELPSTARLAEPILRATRGGERVEVQCGNILVDAPLGAFDAVVMRAVVQVLGPQEASAAIANAARCLAPGGRLFVMGTGIVHDDRISPRAGVFMNVTLMNLYTQGEAYTRSEHERWLAAAGCGNTEWVTLPSGASLVSATRP